MKHNFEIFARLRSVCDRLGSFPESYVVPCSFKFVCTYVYYSWQLKKLQFHQQTEDMCKLSHMTYVSSTIQFAFIITNSLKWVFTRFCYVTFKNSKSLVKKFALLLQLTDILPNIGVLLTKTYKLVMCLNRRWPCSQRFCLWKPV
jgi:hypothetical protein